MGHADIHMQGFKEVLATHLAQQEKDLNRFKEQNDRKRIAETEQKIAWLKQAISKFA